MLAVTLLALWIPTIASEAPFPIRQISTATDSTKAILRIRTDQRSPHRIPAHITGKFAEHLGANIYNGMSAQILRNSTFADFPFGSGQVTPDGITRFHSDEERIVQEIKRQAPRLGWPDSELNGLLAARGDGLACWWTREGSREGVQVSPDTAPYGQRAQRIQVKSAGQGIAQWMYLPLHRTRQLEFEIYVRSPDLSSLSVSISEPGNEKPAAVATVTGLSRTWRKFSGKLALETGSAPDVAHLLTITTPAAGQFVVGRMLLFPTDHVAGADPDVIRLLKDSRLPILRWPGGNFVSGYHWEDGIGAIEQRPTQPNYAWGGVEPNLFGTDEFIAFCRAVGCEPMICINAGSGTPEEAARWIEYCNGAASSPMGARRAANGHPEPFNVRHWEVGNELWGRWQFHWTTATGYIDRFAAFSEAMRAADSRITLYACGAPVMWGKQWNDALIAGASSLLRTTTDHPLVGGNVSPATDPLDVYRDFMAVPEVLEKKWSDLWRQMLQAGIAQPRLAVTELQLFARIGRAVESNAVARLTRENLVSPATLAEALYDVLIYHAAVRLAPFAEMVTHSATVNHGGGLRKERERVYANPCHYAQAAFAAFAGATPVVVEIDAAQETAPRVLPDLKNATSEASFGAIDALAAIDPDGNLLISIVHRGTSGHIRLRMEWRDFQGASMAEVRSLTADAPWAANSLEYPEAVKPVDIQVPVRENKLELELRPFTVIRVTIPQKR